MKLLARGLSHLDEPDYYIWKFLHSRNLRKFKNVHAGCDCFIMGNGPSLNKMDLTPLNRHFVFGLNKIYLIRERVDLELSYHVAVNPLVIEQSADEIRNLKCPSFVSWTNSRGVLDNSEEGVHYLFTRTRSDYHLFSPTICRPVCEGWTVTFVAMQIAYFMGFRRVFLIGVDHSFKADGDPNEKQLLSGSDPNHFDPNYFANSEWHLPDLEGSELAYRAAKFSYERSDRQIIDATVGGKLDIFPKLCYEKAIDEAIHV